MTSTLLNTGWEFRPKVSAFTELGGATRDWSDVTIPHDALIGTQRDPELPNGAATGYFRGGAFEYRTGLALDPDARGSFVALQFDGVYRDAAVFVNGNLAGQRAFGYSRFAVRLDPFLRFDGQDSVRVECRSHEDSRWYSGAGIHRDVHLIVKKPVHFAIDGVRVTTPDIDADRAVVEIAATVENTGATTATVSMTSELGHVDGARSPGDRSPVTLLPGTSTVVRHRLYVDAPRLWSVEEPERYEVEVALELEGERVDMELVRFGIRSIQVDPRKGLRINGREVKLRGACIHHDNGPLGAAAIARAEERRVQLLKQAGFNAIRSSHNPASEALLEACDRLGMLVMDEAFDVWTSSKSDFDFAFDFPQWWERDLESMVARAFNHPSVIMYSIGNEIPETGSPDGGVWSRRLAEKVRSLDETRFVTNGINGFVSVLDAVVAGMRQRRDAAAQAGDAGQPAAGGGVNAMMTEVGGMMNAIAASPMVSERTAESFAALDIAGLNYGDGRYALERELFPNRIVVGTETFPGNIAHNWALVSEHSHVIGDFTWTGWDYLGEAGIGGVAYSDGTDGATPTTAKPYPWLTAWTGDIDITGRRRPISFYREVVFGLRSDPFIAVHRPQHRGKALLATPWSWSDAIDSWSWDGFEGQPLRVEVYARADQVELQLDGRPIARRAVGAELAFRADFEVEYEPGELTAVAFDKGVEIGRTSLRSAGSSTRLQVTSDRSRLSADTQDLAFVDIAITDDRGVEHRGWDRTVHVEVDGSAVLQGLASANPESEDRFTDARCRTFDGRALAIIRPTAPGPVRVTVSARGCEPVRLELSVTGGTADARDTGAPDHETAPAVLAET
ncbi:beta-galactosidase [Agrococcus sp. UYP33]